MSDDPDALDTPEIGAEPPLPEHPPGWDGTEPVADEPVPEVLPVRPAIEQEPAPIPAGPDVPAEPPPAAEPPPPIFGPVPQPLPFEEAVPPAEEQPRPPKAPPPEAALAPVPVDPTPLPAPEWHCYAIIDSVTGEVIGAGRHLHEPGQDPPEPALAPGHTQMALTLQQFEAVGGGAPHKLVDGVLVAFVRVVPLDQIKAEAIEHIDASAERARLRFISPGAGQALEYRATLDEAHEAEADPAPHPDDYPWLMAEVGAQAAMGNTLTIKQAAASVLAQAEAWAQAGAAIKRLRREAKMAVGIAETEAQVRAAAYGIAWPAPG